MLVRREAASWMESCWDERDRSPGWFISVRAVPGEEDHAGMVPEPTAGRDPLDASQIRAHKVQGLSHQLSRTRRSRPRAFRSREGARTTVVGRSFFSANPCEYERGEV